MDEKIIAGVLATCSAIGYQDGDQYFKDPDCLASVKDLILFLRRDDDDHSIRRLLGQSDVVSKDLLPLIKHFSDDIELYDIVLRLLVNLTNPALLVYEEEIPKNKTYRNFYHQITLHLQSYKQAFADQLVMKKICDRLKKLISLDWENRLENDKLTIERILLLLRNILQVPANPSEEKRNDDDASVHDQIVHVMHQADLLNVIIKMSSNSDSAHEYSLHIIEIISLMLREQTGEQLAKTNSEISLSEKLKHEEQELMQSRAREAVLKSVQIKKVPIRHSRFGGTFEVRDIQAPSGRHLLCHKPISSLTDLRLDAGKKTKKIPVNRRPISEADCTRRSTLSIRLILQRFCSQFLKTSYNFLMGLVKDRIDRSKTQEHDETYYLWAMRFFMEFNRYFEFRLEYVSETMSTGTFHYVQTLLDNYHEMMITDKEKIPVWSKRAHSALRAYQELLYTLLWIDKCGAEITSSRSIKNNVFYLPEYRELCYSLLVNFDPVKFSKTYIHDLIETNHLFLKMLEDYSKNTSERKILVKVKRKKPARRGKPAQKPSRIRKTPEELEEMWERVSVEVSTAVVSEESPNESVNVIPFDGASDLTIDEQKPKSLERIAVLLHQTKYIEAVTLFRNAREVWPDLMDEVEVDLLEEDVAVLLKSIFLLKSNGLVLPAEGEAENGGFPTESSADAQNPDVDNEMNNEEDLEQQEISDSDDEDKDGALEARYEEKEQNFDFKGFLDKYANSKIIAHYGRVFQDWASLKPLTLQCVMKFFHRIAYQLDYPCLVCQVSIFKAFQSILNVPLQLDHLKEATKFFHHLWPKFVKMCESNKKMFIEALMWKTARDAVEIQEGYGSYAASKKKAQKAANPKFNWTEVEDNELERLAEEYLALLPEERKASKIVDWINMRFTSGSKVKKTVKTKLTEKGIFTRLKELAPKNRSIKNRSLKKKNIESTSTWDNQSLRENSGNSDSDNDSDRRRDSDSERAAGGSDKSSSEDDSDDDEFLLRKRRRFADLEGPALPIPTPAEVVEESVEKNVTPGVEEFVASDEGSNNTTAAVGSCIDSMDVDVPVPAPVGEGHTAIAVGSSEDDSYDDEFLLQKRRRLADLEGPALPISPPAEVLDERVVSPSTKNHEGETEIVSEGTDETIENENSGVGFRVSGVIEKNVTPDHLDVEEFVASNEGSNNVTAAVGSCIDSMDVDLPVTASVRDGDSAIAVSDDTMVIIDTNEASSGQDQTTLLLPADEDKSNLESAEQDQTTLLLPTDEDKSNVESADN